MGSKYIYLKIKLKEQNQNHKFNNYYYYYKMNNFKYNLTINKSKLLSQRLVVVFGNYPLGQNATQLKV